MTSEPQITADLLHLVWRTFARTLMHELIFRFRRDDGPIWCGPWALSHWGGVRHFGAFENQSLRKGFPLPERGGIVETLNGETRVRIFMDDVFICPQCGALHKEKSDYLQIPWINERKKQVDVDGMWIAVNDRRGTAEFSPRKCKNTRQCSDISRQFYREWRRKNAEDIYNRIWQRKVEKANRVAAEQLKRKRAQKTGRAKVYVVSCGDNVKIGIASDVTARLRMLQTSSARELTLLKAWDCENARAIERFLHEKYSRFRKAREWFDLPQEILTDLLSLDRLDGLVKKL